MLLLADRSLQAADRFSAQGIKEWRMRVLDGILRGIFTVWLILLVSGINNVVRTYNRELNIHKNPLAIAASVIAVYVGVTVLLTFITFNRKLRYELRAGLLLFVLYLIGVVGLYLTALSGDGRIFLFAFVIFTAILFDLRYSLFALGISLLTLFAVGWLTVAQVIVIPADRQLNAASASSWMSGSIVFLVLSIAILISSTYLLRALEQVYAQTQARATEIGRLYAASQDMSASLMDSSALLRTLAHHMTEGLNATSCYIISIDQPNARLTVLAEYWAQDAILSERNSDIGTVYSTKDFPSIMRHMLAGRVLTLQADNGDLSEGERKQFVDYGVKSMLFVPIMAHGNLIGVAEIWESRQPREFTLADIRLAQAMAGHAGGIIENARLFETIRHRTDELEALVEVSTALRTASSVDEMIPILAHQALMLIRGTHASIFLLEPKTGDLISSGWYSINSDQKSELPVEMILRHSLSQGITGHVVETGQIYITEDLQVDPFSIILPGEAERLKNVHSGVSLPLRANEQIIGVFHIWSDEYRKFSNTDIRLLTAVAEIAGSALQRAAFHEQTLQHADELALAYDNTLTGWARALELRDELTEGHTRRVIELTVQLARNMGLSDDELIQVRRGATLHDIGKMAIPDAILNKTGPLTESELQIIHLHPQYAYDMLSSISFLKPALDIPFCHHEHWDGTGYPRGLKREQIPLSARIFAIVDVWDALTSDRPYRKAWPKEKTIEYIKENSGKCFDPQVVEAFLAMSPELN